MASGVSASAGGIRKERLIFGLYLLVLIVALELFLHHFHWPTWPVFLIMIFFFEAHMDKSRAPHLLLGAVVGIACYMLTVQFVTITGETLGLANARLLFICIAVYSIVAFGEVLPKIFNNYAFMFFLVSGLAANLKGGEPEPLLWMALAAGGGLVVIAGVLGIMRLMGRFHQPSS